MEEDLVPAFTTREDGKRWHDNKSATASNINVDSGFLSSGNLQTSGEICDSGLQSPSRDIHQKEGLGDGPKGEIEKREQRPAGATPATATTVSSSSSSAATTIAEPMRVDSGLVEDLGLSESLSQLSLKQVALNPLTGSSRASRGALPVKSNLEPNIELIPLRPEPSSDYDIRSDVDIEPQQQLRDGSYANDNVVVVQEQRATSNEEPWQLYYTQDDDGDTWVLLHVV